MIVESLLGCRQSVVVEALLRYSILVVDLVLIDEIAVVKTRVWLRAAALFAAFWVVRFVSASEVAPKDTLLAAVPYMLFA